MQRHMDPARIKADDASHSVAAPWIDRGYEPVKPALPTDRARRPPQP